jgi:hypothetical protein
MVERRHKDAPDTGARTRRTDRGGAAQPVPVWLTTFHLRRVEHLKRTGRKASASA